MKPTKLKTTKIEQKNDSQKKKKKTKTNQQTNKLLN